MADWATIHLLEGREKWHLGKYHYGKTLWLFHKGRGDTAHDWYAKHMHNGERAAAAKNMQQIEAERGYIRKWSDYMAGELTEIVALRTAIGRLKPKPPSNPYAAKEAWLAREFPTTHDEIRKVVAIILTKFPNLVVTSTISGTHASQSYHYLGRAYDVASGDYGYMDQAAQWIAANLTGRLTEGIHNSGLSVKYGQSVRSEYWGSTTWAGHRDHIHIAV